MRISDWSSDVCSSDLFDCPAMIDTDVNGAALAELRWGAGARGEAPSDSLCYITIGTGVGGGFAFNGHAVHGAMHPEIGHIRVPRAPGRSEEHTSELQSLMRISYAVFCLQKKKTQNQNPTQ